jgi:hypothetical protein
MKTCCLARSLQRTSSMRSSLVKVCVKSDANYDMFRNSESGGHLVDTVRCNSSVEAWC